MEMRGTSCCGVKEASGLLPDPVDTIDQLCEKLLDEGSQQAFILLADPIEFGNGVKAVALIEKESLGKIVAAEPAINPNTKRLLGCWIYTPDLEALRAWRETQVEAMSKRMSTSGFMVGDNIDSKGQYTYYDRRRMFGQVYHFTVIRVNLDGTINIKLISNNGTYKRLDDSEFVKA